MNDRDLRNVALFGVRRLWRRHGDAVPWGPISEGFKYRGERIPFLSPFEGVFKPRQLRRGALSVRSTIASRYEDERVDEDRTWYDYSPQPGRNDWLRECMEDRLPLLYFLQVKPKQEVEYLVIAPGQVIADDTARGRFLLDLNSSELYEGREELDVEPVPERLHRVFERRYGVSEVRTRLFQAHFRREVLGAYDRRCSVCALKESPLLDGAHLVPDREELGAPRVQNGLSLCALHHRAFGRDLLGVTPELTVHVFCERLEAPDEEPTRIVTRFHGRELRVPDHEEARPDPELVEHRWEQAREGLPSGTAGPNPEVRSTDVKVCHAG